MKILEQFQENSYVRATEVNPLLCPIVSGLGNTCAAIIRLVGYTISAASNHWNKSTKDYNNKETKFYEAWQQLAWGILMLTPGLGVSIGNYESCLYQQRK